MTAEPNTEGALEELLHPVVRTSAIGEERIFAANYNISKYLGETVILLHIKAMDVIRVQAGEDSSSISFPCRLNSLPCRYRIQFGCPIGQHLLLTFWRPNGFCVK